MGNRGIIHNPDTKILHTTRRWTHRAWLICLCEFKGRKRPLMAPNTYTELFFLDEATALAAGHRPCFECRRADAERFRTAWAAGQSGKPPRAGQMDTVLHAERLDGREKRLHPLPVPPDALPDGVMLADGDYALLCKGGRPWLWSPEGYRPLSHWPAELSMLTPPSTCATLAAGYAAQMHPSATDG